MDKSILRKTILEQWRSFGLENQQNQISDLSLDIIFWEDAKQKKSIQYKNSVFLDDRSMTVFYWESSRDESKGFFGDGDVDVTVQSGKTLFRKVKHLRSDDSGNEVMTDLNLGDISKAVKSVAKDFGWKFKVVLRLVDAMYPEGYVTSTVSQNTTDTEPRDQNSGRSDRTVSKPIKDNQPKKMGITFWIAWTLLSALSLVACFGIGANWIAYPIVIGILFLALLLRKFLFKGFIKGSLLLIGTLIAIFVVLIFNLGDQSLSQDTQAIQEAFESQDIQVIETYIHPETKAELMPIFTEHQSELSRIAELMKTKKLVYSDRNYAEYEVTDNGQNFTMVFEKVGDTWLLVRF